MKKHILLVDNDRNQLRNFIEALNKTGIAYKCTWAQSGEQALGQLQYLSPHIIFINAALPGIGSLELSAALRRIAHLADSRVILYTGHITPTLRQQAAALGAYSCISADVNTDITRLKRVLQPSSSLATA